jgi:hypothetical protein
LARHLAPETRKVQAPIALTGKSNCSASRDRTGGRYEDRAIDRFCEGALRRQGRSKEAYRRYGLRAAAGTTNLAAYRALVRSYPDRDRRGILLDLIESRGEKGKWFAAAKDAGFLDVALDCASADSADPATLVRAARNLRDTNPPLRDRRRAPRGSAPAGGRRL